MEKFITRQQIARAKKSIERKIQLHPKVAIILGSGLGELAEAVTSPVVIPYASIPGWPISTVEGHAGKLICGFLGSTACLIMQGRIHYYEGYRMDEVTFPIRVINALGIENLIVTNAAGAINPRFVPGDVMVITDHISLISMTGLNPLRGPNLHEFGERFPDMSQCYDRKLIGFVQEEAHKRQIKLQKGIYVCLSGPSFETPADLRFLQKIGADAVGMSTVPEVIIARHGGMKVLGLSGISNKANLDGETVTTHEEVLEAGKVIYPKLQNLIVGVISRL